MRSIKGAIVIVLKKAGLVFLENPKTATQSVRQMLAEYLDDTPAHARTPHINSETYWHGWFLYMVEYTGKLPETFSVMREPLDHIASWYRYRQRKAIRGHENSTYGISFADFVEALLLPDPPPFARIGRQSDFMGFRGGRVFVNYIFDYRQLDLLVVFLSNRLGKSLSLGHTNISPKLGGSSLKLPKALYDYFVQARAREFELYQKVSQAGLLITPHQRNLRFPSD